MLEAVSEGIALDPEEAERQEIRDFVAAQLGPALASHFQQEIRSSVGTGCYDHSFRQADYSKILKYVDGLKKHWLSKQPDATHILVKVQELLAFGSESEKKQLKKLLELP